MPKNNFGQEVNKMVQEASFSDEDLKMRNDIKSLGYEGDELESIFNQAKKSQREAEERNRVKKDMNEWEKQNSLKPKSATPEQMDNIRKKAIKTFGITNNFNHAFYMLPDGRMLNGSGSGYGRDRDHRDIGESYLDANVDIQQLSRGGNSHNMEDFMRHGNLRIMPENNSIELYNKPTSQQYRQIVNLWRNGYLNNLEANSNYLEDIQSERQIADFFKKAFGE